MSARYEPEFIGYINLFKPKLKLPYVPALYQRLSYLQTEKDAAKSKIYKYRAIFNVEIYSE
jgi:hypothetical protein